MKFERIALSILAILPFKAIAFAAEARLTTLAGLDANEVMDSHHADAAINDDHSWNLLLKRKNMLFKPLEMTATPEQAYERFVEQSGLRDSEDAVIEFNALIDRMVREGMIKTDEKQFVSSIPSTSGV